VVAYTSVVKYLPPEAEDAETIITLAIYSFWVGKQVVKMYRARKKKAIMLPGQGMSRSRGSSSASGTVTVSKDIDTRWNVLQTAGTSVDLRWKVEAPNLSLARRLEELASWYLHVS
jgi:hypothetical protein